MKQERIDKIIHEIYVNLYKVAEPSADFDELVNNAKVNEEGLSNWQRMAQRYL